MVWCNKFLLFIFGKYFGEIVDNEKGENPIAG